MKDMYCYCQAVLLEENAHFCTALMPVMGDCKFSEASVLFVEFREMKFYMVSIEHGSGRAGDLTWDLSA